ncbi:MAG: FHA domain-containing protein [Deltaproteobacteria bacterium]|nr:FHA domain-containing protein [Deltaproteobacteria bacterium]
MFVLDFFKGLVRSRVTGVKVSAQGRAYAAQAKVKGKIAGKFNKAVDGSVKKAKGVARGKGGGPGNKKERKKMGFSPFSKKKGSKQDPDVMNQTMTAEDAEEAKTQAINVAEFDDTQFQPCVGWVVIMDGPQKGRDFRLVPGRNRIGTDADMEVVLTDPYVSSHHATIVYNDEGIYQISDAGSTNGSKVNGKKVMQAQIVDNDNLQLGHTALKFKALE